MLDVTASPARRRVARPDKTNSVCPLSSPVLISRTAAIRPNTAAKMARIPPLRHAV